MEQILDLMNQHCHFSGNMYQCPWKFHHFGGLHIRNYCYNYHSVFRLCKSCEEYSNTVMSMLSRQNLILTVLTKQEATIKKLSKKIKKLEGINVTPKKVKVPSLVPITPQPTSEYHIPYSFITSESISPDVPDAHNDEYYSDSDKEQFIFHEKTRLLPESVKFKDEIELTKLHGGNS